jgi:hypothetical protein
VAATVTDANVSLVITMSSYGAAARMVSKYRPAVPQVCAQHCVMVMCRVCGCRRVAGAFNDVLARCCRHICSTLCCWHVATLLQVIIHAWPTTPCPACCLFLPHCLST